MTLSVFLSSFLNACVCNTPTNIAEYQRILSTATTYTGICGNLVMNSLNQIMAFMGAGFIYSFFFGGGIGVGLKSEGSSQHFWKFALGAMAMTLAFAPFLDLTYRLNEWLLQGTEFHGYASGLEAQAMVLTKAMLDIDTLGRFAATMIAIAIIPALAEEYLFRGALQPLFAKWSGNIHIGIWVSAIIFSAIHFQFFGFIPRMLLGAGFGYLVVASGNIWTAILCHFINNASAVIAAYYFGSEWLETGLDPSSEPWGLSQMLSIAIFAVVIWAISKKLSVYSVWSKNETNYLERGL